MRQSYRSKMALLGTGLLLASTSYAQSPPPDSVQRPPKLLLKAGLRLTHLRYAHDSKSWQFLLPLALGAEYQVASRLSCYT